MEKHTCIQTFDSLLGDLNITEIIKYAHMQISALMGKYVFDNDYSTIGRVHYLAATANLRITAKIFTK